MTYDLVIDSGHGEVEIALLKDQVLTELHSEKGSEKFSVGDLYLGRVKKVVPSLNAAFVEVGYEKDAFLHYLDLGPMYRTFNSFTQKAQKGKLNTHLLENFPEENEIEKEGKITDVISSGDNILVQVAKEPISNKGPRLSCEITLAGRYIVLVPFSNKISISQKIRDSQERDRLRRLMQSIRPDNFGVIIRTVAQKKKVAELDADLRDLVARWKKTFENLRNAKAPMRVLGEINKTSAILRDLLNADFNSIQVNDDALYDQIKSYIKKKAPEKESIVKHYKGSLPIFEQFGVHKQIKAAFGKKIMLKSGAYLIIEHTEAMHVIDVNSGNRSSSENQEQNALETNMESAEEIARVIRLRDMGGIICVDFIDMMESAHQKKLFDKLIECMKPDKAKHHILPPSKFGVVEITRQRVRPEIEINTSESCPTCNGTGEIQPSVLFAEDIETTLAYLMQEYKPSKIRLRVHPYIEAYLKRNLFKFQRKWFSMYKLWIKIIPDTTLPFLVYKFENAKGEVLD
ncbi:Rne/Rng family ribonuclease [Luteibaculum oceani]|uniref:Rne/Rng family ribonuclease n=1 Tax=Luteibaculum oceani TaxID=1294296 RepID=A0A5C6V9H9_9FLAO|nr:Rne/Rng family ribonuclease [Luteibaculum oceani]TXC81807.1 Rne/Rng family ribonuclease [Luteibaculum oceani]